jgi:hypothetical protein
MCKVIIFYVPANFKSSPAKWMLPSKRGKIIEFHMERSQKSA